jgi:hypothetical protein
MVPNPNSNPSTVVVAPLEGGTANPALQNKMSNLSWFCRNVSAKLCIDAKLAKSNVNGMAPGMFLAAVLQRS